MTYGNSTCPKNIIRWRMERGQIVVKAVRAEDCMLLQTEVNVGYVSSAEISNLDI